MVRGSVSEAAVQALRKAGWAYSKVGHGGKKFKEGLPTLRPRSARSRGTSSSYVTPVLWIQPLVAHRFSNDFICTDIGCFKLAPVMNIHECWNDYMSILSFLYIINYYLQYTQATHNQDRTQLLFSTSASEKKRKKRQTQKLNDLHHFY